ncbi:MAG: acetylxylan esterase [Verrucomicrobiales bacterium]|nr:acetylxylan esterase [Verrucomicrobiales bacterium]
MSLVRGPQSRRPFSAVTNLTAWNQRAAEIRSQILVSAGLSPLPTRTPLEARIFGRVDGDGYTIERVQFQPSPGVYLAGNLYRPRTGAGPFPAILCPHGHWSQGRLEATEVVNVPARCIHLARLGFVVFSHDMIGYQDTIQFNPKGTDGRPLYGDFQEHHAATFREPALALWNLNLLGQQLWNCVRALDFLSELPEVDPERLGCTGASAGATQAMLLAAVDYRIKACVPASMVSHAMQGECACENAPGLRIGADNVEIAACIAPRPLLLVGATEDWSRTSAEIEGPEIARIYGLMGATNQFRAVRVEGPANFNQASRELMYGWFARSLLGRPNPSPIAERPFTQPSSAELRVYPEGRPPPGALTLPAFTTQWIQRRQEELTSLLPTNRVTFTNYLRTFVPNWARVMAIDGIDRPPLQIEGAFGRGGRGDRVERRLLLPEGDQFGAAVVLVHPEGRKSIAPGGPRAAFARKLLENRIPVLAFDPYRSGSPQNRELPQEQPLTNFFTTYNRTLLQERVGDVLNAITYVRQVARPKRVILVGEGAAGLWALLASRAADAVVADAGALDLSDDRTLLSPEFFVPGIRQIGGPDGVASLAAPRPLWIHHSGDRFPTPWTRASYAAAEASDQLRISPDTATEASVLHWILTRAKP